MGLAGGGGEASVATTLGGRVQDVGKMDVFGKRNCIFCAQNILKYVAKEK